MKLTITHDTCPCSILHFPEVADYPSTLYVAPEEMNPTRWPHYLRDLNRQAVFDSYRMILTSFADMPSREGAFQAPSYLVHLNAERFFEILRELHRKKIPRTVIDLDALPSTAEVIPLLGVAQLARHPNLRNPEYLGATLQFFRRALPTDKWLAWNAGFSVWTGLLADISRIIRRAKLFAHRDEFYFDGRWPGGCGYNGGIILHGDHYGIHT